MAASHPIVIDYNDPCFYIFPSDEGTEPVATSTAIAVTPGRIFRDSQVYGIQPGLVGEAIFDDDDSSGLDADSDPRVGLTDSLDPDFYASGDYATPAKLNSYFKDKIDQTVAASAPPASSDSSVE